MALNDLSLVQGTAEQYRSIVANYLAMLPPCRTCALSGLFLDHGQAGSNPKVRFADNTPRISFRFPQRRLTSDGYLYDFAPIMIEPFIRGVRPLMHESSESKKESKESRARGSPSRSCQERSLSQRV